MTYAIAYTVTGYAGANVENIVLSGLDAEGLVESVIYSSQFGTVSNVSISTY